MIDMVIKNDAEQVLREVRKTNTLLIAGKTGSPYAVNQICYYELPETVFSRYGDTGLSEAFKLAKDMGAPHVFVANIQDTLDYLDLAETLRHYDFTYVAFTDLYLSDAFFDAARGDRRTHYASYFLEASEGFNETVFFFTDKHAFLYQDLDAFLVDMKKIASDFKNSMPAGLDGKKICFVANQLKQHTFANVALAASLANTDLEKYPKGPFGDVVFSFDDFDVGDSELIFFKDYYLTGTQVENLVNFSKDITPQKSLLIDRIVKYVKREIDLSSFHGKRFGAYQKLNIEKALREKLDQMADILRSYKILDIRMIKDHATSGIVEVELDIWPENSIERFSVVLEV